MLHQYCDNVPPLSAARRADSTRFLPPERQSGHLERPRIHALLGDVVERHRVSLVTAASGFGKTSAVSAWAAGRDDVVWLTLGPFDDSPARLGASLIRALQTSSHRGSVPPEIRQIDPESHDLESAFDVLTSVMEMSEGPLVLVIDDAQRAGEALTAGLLGALLDAGPASLRIVIVGTPLVDIVLSRWLLTHADAVIGAESLAFDLPEVEALADGTARLAPEAVLADTQGWPIAVRVLLLTGVAPDPERSDRDAVLRAYVGTHVLGALEPELARFVRETSICADLTVELAAAVSGSDDAANLLELCVRRGLFIDRFVTGGESVYRWHSLFAQQCRSLLREDAAAYACAHRRAAIALSVVDLLTAVAHWREADDLGEAVGVIRAHWVGIVVGPEAATLDRVCASLPMPYADDPSILLIRACAQDVCGAHEPAKMLFQRAAARGRVDDPAYARVLALAKLFILDAREEVMRASEEVQEHLASAAPMSTHDNAATFYLIGWTHLRHRRAAAHAAQMLAAAARDAESVGDTLLMQRSLGHLAVTYAWAGRMGDASRVLATVGTAAQEDDLWMSYAGGSASTAAGYVAYFADDLDRAETELLAAIRGGSGTHSFAGISRMMLAFTAAARRDPLLYRRAAMEVQEIPREVVQGVSWPAFRDVSIALLDDASGRRDRALAIAERYEQATDLPLVTMGLASIVRRSGDPARALSMLRRLRDYEAVSYIRVSTLMTAAVVQRRQGRAQLSNDLCEEALQIGVAEGIRRPFSERDLELRQLLSEHIAWGSAHEDFVVACLAPRSAEGPLERLSERERAVFDQLRSTRTIAEIADTLSVSINTIKTHQRSIYRKLGVASRREATRLVT